MRTRVPCVWFVEPIGKNHDQTNKIISELLPEENAVPGVRCADGREHNLWRCTSWESVNKLDSCSDDMKLCFKVWVQRGRNALIRHWPFRQRRGTKLGALSHNVSD